MISLNVWTLLNVIECLMNKCYLMNEGYLFCTLLFDKGRSHHVFLQTFHWYSILKYCAFIFLFFLTHLFTISLFCRTQLYSLSFLFHRYYWALLGWKYIWCLVITFSFLCLWRVPLLRKVNIKIFLTFVLHLHFSLFSPFLCSWRITRNVFRSFVSSQKFSLLFGLIFIIWLCWTFWPGVKILLAPLSLLPFAVFRKVVVCF